MHWEEWTHLQRQLQIKKPSVFRQLLWGVTPKLLKVHHHQKEPKQQKQEENEAFITQIKQSILPKTHKKMTIKMLQSLA